MPIENVTGKEYAPLIKNPEWKTRRLRLMAKGKLARRGIAAACHSASRQKKVGRK